MSKRRGGACAGLTATTAAQLLAAITQMNRSVRSHRARRAVVSQLHSLCAVDFDGMEEAHHQLITDDSRQGGSAPPRTGVVVAPSAQSSSQSYSCVLKITIMCPHTVSIVQKFFLRAVTPAARAAAQGAQAYSASSSSIFGAR